MQQSLLMAGLLALISSVAIAAAPQTTQSLVHAGRMLDVESGKWLMDQDIFIESGKIISISAHRADRLSNPSLASKRVDWSAYAVIPGLMDMHTHLADEAEMADPMVPLRSNAARDAFIGAQNARKTLQAGFTTVRDVGTYRGFADVALRDAIKAGRIPGPRMFVAGAYITISGGGGELTGLPKGTKVPEDFRRGVANNAREVRQKVNALFDGGVDFIKVIATGAVLAAGTEPGQPEYSEAEIRAAVETAARRSGFVTAHAHGAEGIKRAVRAGVRSIEHGSLMDDESIALMKAHGTWLVADIYNGDYIDTVGRAAGWSEEILRKNTLTTETQREGFRKAVAAGVKIAFGTDAGVYPHGDNARQFAYMVRYGMTPLQAIQSATIESARLLGQEASLGSISEGKVADLVALACDPIDEIECMQQVSAVIQAGEVVGLAD